MSKVLVKKKGFFNMSKFPRLESRIVIDYANPVTSKKGIPYVAVGFTNDRGYQQNYWFPNDFLEFAQSHVGKEVTATFNFFSSRERTTLSGVMLSE